MVIDKNTIRTYLEKKTDIPSNQIEELMGKVDAYVAGDQMAPEVEERVGKVVEEAKRWDGT